MSASKLDAVDRGIPRRLSLRPSERFFDAGLAVRLDQRVDVFLDGELLDEVSSWDTDAGIIMRKRRDGNGRLVLEEGVPTFETLKGTVEVRWSKEHAA